MATFALPKKLPTYLVRLEREYRKNKKEQLRDLVENCRAYVVEGAEETHSFGEIHIGHDIKIFVPLDMHAEIPLNEVNALAHEIQQDIVTLASGLGDEYFRTLSLELFDDDDADFQKSRPFTGKPSPNPETLSFWVPGSVRVFISHRDAHKVKANELAAALANFGLSCFVAHDTITPNEEWRTEILKGLQSMEVLLAFVTDDFESPWTNQEVGFALGRSTPIISAQLEKLVPPGFISNNQAVKGRLDQIGELSRKLAPVIYKAIGDQDRLVDALIGQLALSPSFHDTSSRFKTLEEHTKSLTDAQIEKLVEAFNTNSQISNCYYVAKKSTKYVDFLNKHTGHQYVVIMEELMRLSIPEDDDDLPF